MNIIAANQDLTMSSREIAELTGKRHDNVRRTIESLWDLSLISVTQSEEPTVGGGKPTKIYQVNEEDSYIVVARLSPEFTAKIVKRWRELESKQQMQIPSNFAEALQLAADQAKALELAAPKVAFVDNFVETGTTKTLRETAKILNYPERKMIALMVDHDILYRMSGKLLPYQKYHEQKLFEVKTGERNGHAFTQTRVTTKGLAWLGERYASDLMEDK